MTRAIVWKEFREQGLIGLTLIVLGTGVLVAAAVLADPPTAGAGPGDVVRLLGAGRLATLLLAVTAGTVCGGALFAAEREAGTMGFLESLPASRWRVWRAKLAAGSVLVVLQVGLVVAVAAALGLVESSGWAAAIGVYSLLAFAWGVFGSTLARTTLGSVGVAVPTATLAAFSFLLPIMVLFHTPGSTLLRGEGVLLFVGLMFAAPLAGSAYRFTRADRVRAADDRPPLHRPLARHRDEDEKAPPPQEWEPDAGGPRLGLVALAWLSVRQLLRPGLILAGFALAFGFTLLVPVVYPVLAWPPLALAAGMLAGVTVFADEQAHGTARFWGERRLPLGRMWAVKMAVHALFALGLAALLAAPLVVQAAAHPGNGLSGPLSLSTVFRTLLFDTPHLGPQAWKYLLAPLAYGFAAGHLCGMLFRKTVVAAGVAGLVGGTAAALWVPSLLAGGVAHWQVWLPPAAALLTARLLVRAWAADRLTARAPLTTLAAGVGAVVLVTAIGLGYRAVEVPDDPAGEADERYVVGLAPFEANDAGRGFRSAAERYARFADAATADIKVPAGTRRPRYEEMIDAAAYRGWPTKTPDLGEWLTKVYEADRRAGDTDETWYEQARRYGAMPTGMYEHPQRTGTTAGSAVLDNARRLGGALVAHGLQRQDAGDPAAFPDDLRTALALARSLRNGSIVAALKHGNEVTTVALAATQSWLRHFDGPPDLLRKALQVVGEDDRTVLTRFIDGQVFGPEVLSDAEPPAFDPTPHLLAERFVTRELVKAPGQWLPTQLTPPGVADKEAVAPVVDLVGLAWSVPWERERSRRLLGLGFDGGTETHRLVRGRPGAALFTFRGQTPNELRDTDRQVRTLRRGVLLMLAVRLYWAETGAAPPALAALVPEYLPAVPTDPYDGRPFRYRVSAGEELVFPPQPMATGPAATGARLVEPGEPVLWSVGTNRADDGGRNPPFGVGLPGRGDDIVFLVPRPPAR